MRDDVEAMKARMVEDFRAWRASEQRRLDDLVADLVALGDGAGGGQEARPPGAGGPPAVNGRGPGPDTSGPRPGVQARFPFDDGGAGPYRRGS